MSQYLILIVNFAGMMALTAIAFAFVMRSVTVAYARQVLLGFILGLGATLVSFQPVMHINGLQIDPRNLFVGCAGAFAGPIGGLISFTMAAATRYLEEGPSANVCVLSLFLATCLGLVWRLMVSRSGQMTRIHLLLLGPAISLSFVCTFLLPRSDWAPVFSYAIPFLVVTNIIGAFVLGGFLERERRRDLREKALRVQASVDPLTGLFNRRAFEEAYRVAALRQTPRGAALLLIDLDHFKKVNDTYGHAVGDRVLVAVAELLRESLRGTDLAARLGGEEFAVFLPNTGREKAREIAERARSAMAEISAPDNADALAITTSIGVCWSHACLPMETALELSDRALYQAKMHGRDQIVLMERNAAATPSEAHAFAKRRRMVAEH
ncbi:diguanylate cyclase [Martelella alba]|uniref:diguanylate cyclase n=1 Tax=Martelella alba TaxID=2590451 RepID=A0A506U8W7_9HYPH|nr:diguanylate cyclase [Martelella alba]TPW30872.1 diguanylate cyclase [Martelella alba]